MFTAHIDKNTIDNGTLSYALIKNYKYLIITFLTSICGHEIWTLDQNNVFYNARLYNCL